MGLGKSAIALTALLDLMTDSFEVRKTLVVAPLRVARDTWPAEIEKWDHLRGLKYAVAVGTEAQRKAALARRAHVYIINRENVEWLVSKSGLPFDYDMVVVDELSSFKSHKAKRFKALLKARPAIARIVGLTGTPAANGLMDLWAEYRLLDMGQRLGRFIGRYREEFFAPDKRNAQTVFSYKPKPGAEGEIYRRIEDITISMRGADCLRLPEIAMSEAPVRMDGKERAVYDKLKKDLAVKEPEITAANAAALCGKLLQLANGAVYGDAGEVCVVHSRKLDALEDLIEAACGKPVLVAYWYRHDLARIRERIPAAVPLGAPGAIKKWCAGEIPVAAIHPASAGHGLNLQSGGSTLIWFGLTWSLELYQQTNARLWRQGQKDTVVIRHIVAEGTIDEQVMAALAAKDKTQAALIEAVKANL